MTDADDLWAARSDEELLRAASELDEYTEEGERIIRAELRRRHLPPPAPAVGRCARCGRSIFDNVERHACAQCGEPYSADVAEALGGGSVEVRLVPVLRTADAGLMLFAKSLLEGELIVCEARGERVQDYFGVGRLGGYNVITGPASLWVRATDEPRARTLLDGLSDASAQPPTDANDEA